MKTCTACRRALSEDRFHRSRHHKSGLYPRCKECKNRDTRSNQRRATERARARAEAMQPTVLELRLEEEYLMDRLALVRRWLNRLAKAVTVAAAASCSSAPNLQPEEVILAAHAGVVEQRSEIDLAPLLNVTLARAEVAPDYIGSGEPPPTFAPHPGTFRQLRRECVADDGGRPLLMMADQLPKQGKRFKLVAWTPGVAAQSIAMSTTSGTLPDGAPLPQPIRGAPGCMVEVRLDSVTPLAPGRAEFDLILPPGSAGLRVYMQTHALLADANDAGILTSQGYEMVIGQ